MSRDIRGHMEAHETLRHPHCGLQHGCRRVLHLSQCTSPLGASVDEDAPAGTFRSWYNQDTSYDLSNRQLNGVGSQRDVPSDIYEVFKMDLIIVARYGDPDTQSHHHHPPTSDALTPALSHLLLVTPTSTPNPNLSSEISA